MQNGGHLAQKTQYSCRNYINSAFLHFHAISWRIYTPIPNSFAPCLRHVNTGSSGVVPLLLM